MSRSDAFRRYSKTFPKVICSLQQSWKCKKHKHLIEENPLPFGAFIGHSQTTPGLKQESGAPGALLFSWSLGGSSDIAEVPGLEAPAVDQELSTHSQKPPQQPRDAPRLRGKDPNGSPAPTRRSGVCFLRRGGGLG